MAKYPANQTRAYIDEFALSGYITSHDYEVTQAIADVTCLSDAGPRRVVDNYDVSAAVNGFFDGAAGAFDQLAFSDLATDEDHLLGITYGLTEGSVAKEAIVQLEGQPRSGGVGGAILLNLSAVGRGRAVQGKILRSATVTGAGNGTGQNLGATISGQESVTVFRLLSFSGTSITMKVQESSDDGGGDAYADLTSHTSGALTAAGVVRVATTAATEAYKRLVVSGTFTSALILVTHGVAH